jgi:hypothetical protein
MKILGIYDNGGKTFDRYTVVYDLVERPAIPTRKEKALYFCVGMSKQPFHPQGFGQHSSANLGRHLGKRIKFEQLPLDCQKLVKQDLGGLLE